MKKFVARCAYWYCKEIENMVHKLDLVIIGVLVGLAVGIAMATLVFLGIQWYRRRSCLRRSAHNSPPSALPIHKSGVNTSDILSESLSNSVTVKLTTYPEKYSPTLYNNNNKERLASVPGLLKYSYKYVFLTVFVWWYVLTVSSKKKHHAKCRGRGGNYMHVHLLVN